jgi:hypothetical protein
LIEISGETYTLRWSSFGDIWGFDYGAILNLDTPCPFGNYTIVEGSKLQGFKVQSIL